MERCEETWNLLPILQDNRVKGRKLSPPGSDTLLCLEIYVAGYACLSVYVWQIERKHWRFPKMFSLNSLDSVTKIFVIPVKVLKADTSCVRDQDATTVPARHT